MKMKIENAVDDKSMCQAEYAKDSRIKAEDIGHLMEWLNKEAHLPKIRGRLPLLYSLCTYLPTLEESNRRKLG